MKAVDTNVLVRILVTDDKQMEEVKLAREFARKAKIIFVPQIVQIKLVWVLEYAYKLDKSEILYILQHLETNEAFHLQKPENFSQGLRLFSSASADFSDCMILIESKNENCEILSFDKKFSRLSGVKLLHHAHSHI